MTWLASLGFSFAALLILAAIAAFILFTRVVRGESDRLLVVTGWVGRERSAIIQHGGLRFVWPLVQKARWLPLRPYTVNIKLDGALSKENIRVSLPCTFIVGVDSSNMPVMQSAAIRIIDVIDDENEFRRFIQELVFGQMRAVISTMTIEQINADRQEFQQKITDSVSREISKVGLDLISVNIQDIRDDAHYIENLGKKAAAEAEAKAVVAIAEQKKIGATGQTTFEAEQRKAVADNNLLAIKAENSAGQSVAASNAELARVQKEVEATNASQASIVASNADREARTVEAENERRVYDAQAVAAKSQEALEVARARVEAQPAAEKLIIEQSAQGKAAGERERERMLKEAEGIQAVLEAKAAGVKKLVEAAGGDPMAAVLLAMNDSVPQILETYARSISERKIDNLVCIGGESGSSLSSLTRDLVAQVPQAREILAALGFSMPGLKPLEKKPNSFEKFAREAEKAE